MVPITYIIERRDLPGQEYRRIHSGITTVSHKISGYDVTRDYMYRVVAENEYGVSDATSAMSMYGKTGQWEMFVGDVCGKDLDEIINIV